MWWIFGVIVALWLWAGKAKAKPPRKGGSGGAAQLVAPTPAPGSQAALDPAGYARLWSAAVEAARRCEIATVDGAALTVLRYAGLPADAAAGRKLADELLTAHGCAARPQPIPPSSLAGGV